MTQNKLAQIAKVSARAVTYWESGQYTPHQQEMQAILVALNVSPYEKTQIMMNYAALRGENGVRADAAIAQTVSDVPLVGAGELLGALRLRRGFFRGQTASLLGVSESTLGRWENNRVDIPASILPLAQTVLSASLEEILALQNRMALPQEEDMTFSLEQCEQWVEAFQARLHLPGMVSAELDALALQRKLWLLSTAHREARLLLAHVTQAYAGWLVSQRRRSEARYQAQSALTLYAEEEQKDTALAAALNLLSWAKASGPQSKMEQGARFLRSWLPRLTHPENQINVLADVSVYTAMSGNMELAMRDFREACRICERLEEAPEVMIHYLQVTGARLLLMDGKPLEACAAIMRIIPNMENIPVNISLNRALIFTEILLAAGERRAAKNWLCFINERLEQVAAPRHQIKADQLALQLQ